MPCVISSLLLSSISPLTKSAKHSALGPVGLFAANTEIFAAPCISSIHFLVKFRWLCWEQDVTTSHKILGSASFLWRWCKTRILGTMFPEPDKKKKKEKKKLAKTYCIINYNSQLPYNFIQFSFCSCQEQKEPHSVKALRQKNGEYYFLLKQFTFQGTWAEPLKAKMMVNHIPFIHSYFGLGFFPKLAHNISFPWTALVLTVLNTFLPTTLLFFLSFIFLSFFFQVLGASIFQSGFVSPHCPFCVPLAPLQKQIWDLPRTKWYFVVIWNLSLFPPRWSLFWQWDIHSREYLAALASLVLLLYRSYSYNSLRHHGFQMSQYLLKHHDIFQFNASRKMLLVRLDLLFQ